MHYPGSHGPSTATKKRPPNQWQSKRGTPRTAGHDLSRRLCGPLKSMLECQAMPKKQLRTTSGLSGQEEQRKLQSFFCGLKNRDMMAGSAKKAGYVCFKALMFWWQIKSKIV
jgi:hypothetical protein